MSLLTEIITNAHMAGQQHAGCAHPSWGDALGHTHTVLPETLNRAARQHIKVAEQTPTNSKSMLLCDGCNKPFPDLICYCESCLDHVVRMGA